MDFSIKAHQSLTHKIDLLHWKECAKEYREGIVPLIKSNRLAAILFEFPYSFHYIPDNRTYLDELIKDFNNLPVVIEFRNKEWFSERVYEGLAKRNIALCLMDMPNCYAPQMPDEIISDIMYIRFHGRNENNWYSGTNVSRYDYLYNEPELKEWVLRVNKQKEKTKKIRIYFNNHAKGNAVKNANMLKEMFSSE